MALLHTSRPQSSSLEPRSPFDSIKVMLAGRELIDQGKECKYLRFHLQGYKAVCSHLTCTRRPLDGHRIPREENQVVSTQMLSVLGRSIRTQETTHAARRLHEAAHCGEIRRGDAAQVPPDVPHVYVALAAQTRLSMVMQS